MKHYAFRVFRNLATEPILSGTVTASSMDNAVERVIKQNNIEAIHEILHGYPRDYFSMNGKSVGILIYANPEDY